MKKSIFAFVINITLLFASAALIHAAGTPSTWAVQEIEAATKDGLITDSISANYQAYITRAQFCELVLKAYEKLSNTSAEIGDVHFNDTDNPEILKAANLGIVTGHGDGSFAPEEKITREQIATMLSRMIGKAVPSEKNDFLCACRLFGLGAYQRLGSYSLMLFIRQRHHAGHGKKLYKS